MYKLWIILLALLLAGGIIVGRQVPPPLPHRSGKITFAGRVGSESHSAVWTADLNTGAVTKSSAPVLPTHLTSVLRLPGEGIIFAERGTSNWSSGRILAVVSPTSEYSVRLPTEYREVDFVAGYDCRNKILALTSRTDILLYDLEGRKPHRLITGHRISWSPVCPTNRSIAGLDTITGEILIISILDGKIRNRFKLRGAVRPALSPTGSQISYYDPKIGALIVSDVQTKTLRKRLSVPLPAVPYVRAAWSADSKTIAVEVGKRMGFKTSGTSDIYLVDASNGKMWKTPWEVERGCWNWVESCRLNLRCFGI